jgi:hypothetical protein
LLIYIPRRPFAGPGFGTFSTLEGCQRVIEPDLSPLLYKSTSAGWRKLILVLLPNNVANIVHIQVNLQIKFLFFSRKHKAESLKRLYSYFLLSAFSFRLSAILAQTALNMAYLHLTYTQFCR